MLILLLLATVAAAPCRDVAASDPVWQAIDEQYGKIAAAQRAKDIDALAAIYAPDMTVVAPGGTVATREQSLDYSRAAFRVVQREIFTANTILSLRLCGNRATATVLQQWSRIQLADGKPHRFDTAAVQDETWILRDNEWKRWRIENVHPGGWFIDGERVNGRAVR
ncbi:MAG TPA: nuclear transport factor 2 family protein [Thermoanaerobaculia bacterium]|nr:nuclear transport factor 2 family protein [Thermoanaerobaculia bacterium]